MQNGLDGQRWGDVERFKPHPDRDVGHTGVTGFVFDPILSQTRSGLTLGSSSTAFWPGTPGNGHHLAQ